MDTLASPFRARRSAVTSSGYGAAAGPGVGGVASVTTRIAPTADAAAEWHPVPYSEPTPPGVYGP